MEEQTLDLNPVLYVRLKYFDTQSEFATWLSRRLRKNVTQQMVSGWENYVHIPGRAVRELLSPYIGMDEDAIFHRFLTVIKRRKAYDN